MSAADTSEYPLVWISIISDEYPNFSQEFIDSVLAFNYPKSRIILYINDQYNKFGQLDNDEYDQIIFDRTTNKEKIYDQAVLEALKNTPDYYLYLSSEAILTNPDILKKLITCIERNGTKDDNKDNEIIAPKIVRSNTLWTTFWGALDDNGYYARSSDYVEIIRNKKRGIWPAKYLNYCYLINGSLLPKIKYFYSLFIK